MALLLVTAIVLLYGVIYPNLAVVMTSFQAWRSWTLANYREILSQRIVIEAIVSSLGLSIGTVFFCARRCSTCLSFRALRLSSSPALRRTRCASISPAATRRHSGFHFSLRRDRYPGPRHSESLRTRRTAVAIAWLGGVFCFHTYTMYPFFYVLTGAGLRRIDASLAEAARVLGASRITVLRRVLLPQLTPSLVAAALLTFMTSMASFSAPLLFGGDVRVLTLEIFTARQRGDLVMAITETVVLAIISLGALSSFNDTKGRGSLRRR